MKTAEEIIAQIVQEINQEKIRSVLPNQLTKRSGEYRIGLSKAIDIIESFCLEHPPAAPVSREELAEYKKPFRIGRKQKRAILDAEGQFVGVFSPGNENTAKLFCDWANGATLPTREQRGEKEKFAIRFSEWLMIQCEYKNHCVWEYRGEEYTQNELIEIFKRTTPIPSPPKQ